MLEFVYDGQIKAITTSHNCIVQYLLIGGGGGGGGSDSYAGSYGNVGNTVTGQIFLTAGSTFYCLVGSRGGGGASSVRNAGGGFAGYSLNGYSGGTGGNAGPSGVSGGGGGGGGATLVWKTTPGDIAIAGGGGGGGGGGNRSAGYLKYNYGLMPNGRGGAGQHHRGDGGGAGGGGGGYKGGFGGFEPSGDNGAMSGSNGSNMGFFSAFIVMPSSSDFFNAGAGGAPGQDGTNGYAYFYSTLQNLNVSLEIGNAGDGASGGNSG